MSLRVGASLGSYEIGALIGAGGMGEVYRARDPKLNRDVALKVLPALFASDADRLARLTREAQVLASLNHPCIASVYGLEDANGVRALVLELVEGPTLADLIVQGPLDIESAVAIARQIADALAAAHEQGIVHRDLKPGNIKVRPDGTVKVLDFGLAKAFQPVVDVSSASMSPTITTPAMTQAGLILGTAAYMSPEQARGKSVDKRADVWAFGCVLYEMLSGSRAFGDEDVSLTLSRVLQREPDLDLLPIQHEPDQGAPAHCRRRRRSRTGHRARRVLERDRTLLAAISARRPPFRVPGAHRRGGGGPHHFCRHARSPRAPFRPEIPLHGRRCPRLPVVRPR
jgi:serine/threonine protein kinase